MAEGKFINYVRVSTDKQGKSGLGLEAQKKAIDDFLNGGKWKVICEFVEIETGKNNERVELKNALKRCKTTRATLIIAKLDRLSRDSAFIGAIMKSKHEAEMISIRTKAALAAAKARGKVLGNPRNLNKMAAAKGRIAGVKARQNKADNFAKNVSPIINEFKGMSLHKIARELNGSGILTARGKIGSWTASAVKNVLNRRL